MNKIIKDNVYCIDIIIKKDAWFILISSGNLQHKKRRKNCNPRKKTKKTPKNPKKKQTKKPQQFCSLTLDGIYNYECFAIMK